MNSDGSGLAPSLLVIDPFCRTSHSCESKGWRINISVLGAVINLFHCKQPNSLLTALPQRGNYRGRSWCLRGSIIGWKEMEETEFWRVWTWVEFPSYPAWHYLGPSAFCLQDFNPPSNGHPYHLPNAFFNSLNIPSFKSFCLFLWKVCSYSGPMSSRLMSPEKTYFPSVPSRNSRLYILHYIKCLVEFF